MLTDTAGRLAGIFGGSSLRASAMRSGTRRALAAILVVLAAAVTSFLGKPVRIRSAKMLQSPYEIVNPWAQQGRVFVQASHALRTWGRSDQPRAAIRPGVRH